MTVKFNFLKGIQNVLFLSELKILLILRTDIYPTSCPFYDSFGRFSHLLKGHF